MDEKTETYSVDRFSLPHEIFSIYRGKMVASTRMNEKSVKLLASCMFCGRYETARRQIEDNPQIRSNLLSILEPDDRNRISIFFDCPSAEIDINRHIVSISDLFHILRLYRIQDARELTSMTLDSRIIDNMNIFYEIPLVFPNLQVFSAQDCNLSYHYIEAVCSFIKECKHLKGVWLNDNASLLQSLRNAQRSDNHLFAGTQIPTPGMAIHSELDVITDLNPSIEIINGNLGINYSHWGLKYLCTHIEDEMGHIMSLDLSGRGVTDLKIVEFHQLANLDGIILKELDVSNNQIYLDNLANLLLVLPYLSVLIIDSSLLTEEDHYETLFQLCPSLSAIKVMNDGSLVQTIDNCQPVINLPAADASVEKVKSDVGYIMKHLFDFALPMRWSDHPNQYHSLFWCIPEPFVAYMIRHDPMNPSFAWSMVMQTDEEGYRHCCILLWPKRTIDIGEDITMDWLASSTVNGSLSIKWIDLARSAASFDLYLPLYSNPDPLPRCLPDVDLYDDVDDEKECGVTDLLFPLDLPFIGIKAMSDLPEMDEYFRSDGFRSLICENDCSLQEIVISWTAEANQFQSDCWAFSNHLCLPEMDNKALWTKSIRSKSKCVSWLPRSFLLPCDVLDLIRYNDSHSDQRYVIKSAGGNRGWEVTVTSSFPCVLKHAFQVYLHKDIDDHVNPYSSVVSEYINCPLVYLKNDGTCAHKIDFRYFVLVKRTKSGFESFIYKKFLIRLGDHPLARKTQNSIILAPDDDLLSHVTNTYATPYDELDQKIYMTSKQFVDNFDTGHAVKSLCQFEHGNKASNHKLNWNDDIMPKIRTCISECMQYSCKISKNPNQLSSLIGVDVLVGCKCNKSDVVELQPYILELNLSPSLSRAKKEFGDDFMQHVILESFSAANRCGDCWINL